MAARRLIAVLLFFILEIGYNQNKSGPTLQYQHYNGNIEVEVKCLLIGDNSICLFP
ncbi:hypothetical protein P4525_16655 [Peribacillus psychrosaccharolyticus]|nr:hypothetical protein [Peribacillus psychrosaccharolyticus]